VEEPLVPLAIQAVQLEQQVWASMVPLAQRALTARPALQEVQV
jgi:hypothetical protein